MKRNLITVTILICACWILLPGINYLVDGKFKLGGGSHAFIMGRMVETGLAQRYLDKECNCVDSLAELNDSSYAIIAAHSTKAIDIPHSEIRDSLQPNQWDFTGSPQQYFLLHKTTDGFVKIQSKATGKFLTAKSDSNATPVIQLPESNSDLQLFKLDFINNGYCKIVSKSSHRVFDIEKISYQSGALLQLFDDQNGNNQMFKFSRADNPILCAYKDILPNSGIEFLWSNKSPVFNETGGWENSKTEYWKIIKATLSQPKYLIQHIKEFLLAGSRQLFHNQIGDGLQGYSVESSPYISINRFIKYDVKPFSNSREFSYSVDVGPANTRADFFLYISFALILLFVFSALRKSIDSQYLLLIFCATLILIFNAFITAGLANVLDRLQSRLVWIVPLIAILLVVNYFKELNAFIRNRKA